MILEEIMLALCRMCLVMRRVSPRSPVCTDQCPQYYQAVPAYVKRLDVLGRGSRRIKKLGVYAPSSSGFVCASLGLERDKPSSEARKDVIHTFGLTLALQIS
jgi:hypothetical protein